MTAQTHAGVGQSPLNCLIAPKTYCLFCLLYVTLSTKSCLSSSAPRSYVPTVVPAEVPWAPHPLFFPIQRQSGILNAECLSQATRYAWKTKCRLTRRRLVLVDLLVLLFVLLPGLLSLLPVTAVTRLVRLGKRVLVIGTGFLHVFAIARGDAVSIIVGRWQDRRGLVTVTTLVVALRRGWG